MRGAYYVNADRTHRHIHAVGTHLGRDVEGLEPRGLSRVATSGPGLHKHVHRGDRADASGRGHLVLRHNVTHKGQVRVAAQPQTRGVVRGGGEGEGEEASAVGAIKRYACGI